MTLVSPIPSRQRRHRRHPLRSEIHIPRQGDRCSVGASDGLPLAMSPSSVREHNSKLLEIINDVRAKTKGTIKLTPSFYKAVMHELRRIGLSAYTSLGDDFMTKFDELEQKAGKPGLGLTIRSNTFPLLWEMLYTGSSLGDVEVGNFLGFRHRIARFQPGGGSADEEEIESDSDFVFGHHNELGCWQQERDDVEQLVSDRFHFRHLCDVMSAPGMQALASDLSERFIGMLGALELGLLHLACHCMPDPERSGVLFSELVISSQSLTFRVKLCDVKAARRDFGFSLQPLIFLNACKTMSNPEHILQGDSFPNSFLRLGASGVVATACDIPDRFAAAFAAKFYENLLVNVGGRSPTISDALLKTRQFFIDPPYYNPLGLAYGLYARNDLHIEWEPWAVDETEELT